MTKVWWLAGAAAGLAAAPAVAQGPGYPALGREEELRLAISAGPPAVAERADVYLMTRDGFERVIEGDNGWACIVVRSAAQRENLAPHCLNPDAAKTVLRAFLVEGRLQAAGWDAARIGTELKRQFTAGELPLPSGPAHAYMLSKGQRVGPRNTNFRPHFMLYVPYATNAAIGGDLSRPAFPFVGPYENHPLATVVIVMDEFVDPATVKLPKR
ncbi:MAG: hypothetical protein AB7S39_00400 [Gemmatimonadales bacterium]